MIHIIYGTKAQLIKMSPVIRHLKERGVVFNLIDLGQHSRLTKKLCEELGLEPPNFCFRQDADISTLRQGLAWVIGIFVKSLSAGWIRRNIFLGKGGICLIHGDTASTVLGLYLAKRAGMKVAHIEAGLRSFSWLDPFPEEMFRVIAMRFSDILFAPSRLAFDNLSKMGLGIRSVLLPGNTGRESFVFSLQKQVDPAEDIGMDDFALFSFHRMENIFSRKRLIFIIRLIEKVSSERKVVFVQHAPTINCLKKTGLWQEADKIGNASYFKILSHSQFIRILHKSSFVITDGGSIQEEAFYMNKPCLLLRKHTERSEGLGENVMLSGFDRVKTDYFISHYKSFIRRQIPLFEEAPSEAIIDKLRGYF